MEKTVFQNRKGKSVFMVNFAMVISNKILYIYGK